MDDQDYLEFDINQPKTLSSFSFNTVNQQHSPLAYDTIESTPASGSYEKTGAMQMYLAPAPRSQLGVPTKKIYLGGREKFYKPILDNDNYYRGNQFSVKYPFKKAKKFREVVAYPSVVDDNGPIDYLGNNAKIVMRNNDPFYPYPSEHLLENENYWTYMHPKEYVNSQPIYNYPISKIEGGDRGRYKGGDGYNPYLIEQFSGGDCSRRTKIWIIVGLILFVISLYIIV